MTVEFRFDDDNVAPTRDAATVLPVREGPDGRPEIFFVKRTASARFMAGAYVFPGGRVDPSDHDPAVPGDLDEAQCLACGISRSLLVAALRECLEESGLLLSVEPVEPAVRAALRAGIESKSPFASLLRDAGVALRLSALVPYARWVTPRAETKRFDARFFLAEVTPRDGLDGRHDGSETVDSAWITAADAITRAEQGSIVLAPPTWRVLAEVRDAPTVPALLSLGGALHGPFEPSVTMEDDQLCVCLPDDRGPDFAPIGGEHSRLPTAFAYLDGIWSVRR